MHANVVLWGGHVRSMMSRALFATLDQVVHPVVLEGVAVRVKALRLGDQLHLLVVVGCSAVSGNDGPLKVGVLEVGSRVVDRGLGLALFAIGLTLLLPGSVLQDLGTSVADQVAALLPSWSSTLRLQRSYLVRVDSSLRQRPTTSSLIVEVVLRAVHVSLPGSGLSAAPSSTVLLLLSHFLNASTILILTRVVLILVVVAAL